MTDETLQTPEPDGEAPPAQAEDLGHLVQSLQLELGEVKAKSAEYLDGWQRARAEFTNYKKRQERDQIEQYHTTLARVLQRYLEVSDDLERALKARPTEGEGATWAEGVAAIQRKLLGFLEAEGVTPVPMPADHPDRHSRVCSPAPKTAVRHYGLRVRARRSRPEARHSGRAAPSL